MTPGDTVDEGCTFGKVLNERVDGNEKMYLYDKDDQGRKWGHQKTINEKLFNHVDHIKDEIKAFEIKVIKSINDTEKKISKKIEGINLRVVVIAAFVTFIMSIITAVVIEIIKGAL